jgi:hypothetical protein
MATKIDANAYYDSLSAADKKSFLAKAKAAGVSWKDYAVQQGLAETQSNAGNAIKADSAARQSFAASGGQSKNIQDWVTITPKGSGASLTYDVQAKPGAPADVIQAVNDARTGTAVFGGSTSPDNLYRQITQNLGAGYSYQGGAQGLGEAPESIAARQAQQQVAQPPQAQGQAARAAALAPLPPAVAATPNLPTAAMPTLPGQTAQQPQTGFATLMGNTQSPTLPQSATLTNNPSLPNATNNFISPSNVTAWLQANPGVAQNISGEAAAQGVSPADWLIGHMQSNPSDPVVQSYTQGINQYAQQNNLPSATPPPVQGQQAPFPTVPAVPGGNYQQNQVSNQTGQFQTTGTSAQTATNQQQQATTQQQQSASTGNQATTGSSAEQQTGTTGQTSTGTTTTGVQDTLGFGQLLKGAATGASETDAQRNAWLTDLMNNGGSSFNSQVDQAVRNSLTGPQMTGAGDSARARAAGYAGAEVARTNLGQRLQASEQLGGPTALQRLSTTANPYLGQTQKTSADTSGFSNLLSQATNASNTASNQATNTQGSSLSNSLSQMMQQGVEQNTGSTTASSAQAGAGNIPEGQPVSGGGCVLCTAAIELGLSNHRRVLRRVIAHKLTHDWSRFRLAARGYFFLFTPLAYFLLRHPRLASLLWPLAKAVVYEELRVSGRRLPRRGIAWWTHWVGHTVCAAVGCLPVPGRVTNSTILKIAKREGILFEVQS